MKLPDLFKKSTGNIYFGLFLKETEGIGIIIQQQKEEMRVVEKEKFKYSNGWENLIEDVDDLLFRLEQKSNVHVKETIFFVYSHLVDESGNIKQPYLNKIKEMVKNLELAPLGYIECIESVVKHLERQDETPLTAMLLELDETKFSLFVYKGGKVVHRHISVRSDDLVRDLAESFASFKGKVLLPARLILYNSNDLDEESTKIISHRWSEEYFVQIPRVEIIKENDVIAGLVKIFQAQALSKNQIDHMYSTEEKKEVLGFRIGEEIQEEVQTVGIKEPTKQKFQIPTVLPKQFLAKLKSMTSSFKFKLPAINRPQFYLPKRMALFIGIFLVALALFLNELFFHKATVTLFLPFQAISKNISVKTSLQEATTSAELSDSTPTTGIREIGDKAKGSVYLYNFTDSSKKFAAGTVLDSGGIKFILDQDVTASPSSIVVTASGPVMQPGQIKATLTAQDIGPQANFDKGKKFIIDNFPLSTYMAINNESFKGGSKSQIKTVAKKDMDQLKTSVTQKAKEGLLKNTSQIKSGQIVIPDLSQVQFRDTNFSKELGEEADTVTLKAKIDMTLFSYNRNSLLQRITSQLNPVVKSGFVLSSDKINYTFTDLKRNDDEALVKIAVVAKAVKNVSEKTILREIVGKPKSSLEALLKNNFQVEGYEIKINEPLPILSDFLPFLTRNIALKISSL